MSTYANPEPDIDLKRRRFLLATNSVVGALGISAAALPFIAYLRPSQKARAFGAPVSVDFAGLAPGQQLTVRWRGKPVWILRRTPEMLRALESQDLRGRLRDPDSEVSSQQPEYAQNPHRSITPEYLIAVAICTHLGCIPTYRPELAPADLGADWSGGYFCPCHGSKYDLAGRVYKGVPAPLNLEIPPYRLLSNTEAIIGEDPLT